MIFFKKTIFTCFFLVLIFVFGFLSFNFLTISIYASTDTNIDADPLNHFAWSNTIGWIEFRFSGSSIRVEQDRMTGFARFAGGAGHNFISLDCNTGPTGSNCNIPYRVTNDGLGNLSGWAWSDAIGWISFNCRNPETGGVSPDFSCVNSQYQVTIDAQGNFRGWAWNDVVGWISFNCDQAGNNHCASSNYRVRTTWVSGPEKGMLESATFDTNREGGVAFNSIVWRGQLNGGRVGFQLATSNCENGATNAPACNQNIGWGTIQPGGTIKTSGDGAFIGPNGSHENTDLYITGPNIPIMIRNQLLHNNRRYFRYRVYIETNHNRTQTPIVEDITVNWSP